MFTFVFLLTSFIGSAEVLSEVGGRATLQDACASWNRWKTSLQNYSELRLVCDVDESCAGIRCSGMYIGTTTKLNVSLELLMHSCADPVSVDVRLSVPRHHIPEWHHTFLDGENAMLPSTGTGDLFPVDGIMTVFLRRTDEDTVIFGFTFLTKYVNQDRKTVVDKFLSVKNETIVLPPCENHRGSTAVRRKARGYPELLRKGVPVQENGGRACSLEELHGCGENQMCEEIRNSKPPSGACICLPQFHWYNNHDCIPIVPSSPADGAATVGAGSQSKSSPSSLSTAVQIVVPLVLIATIAVLGVLAYRYNWVSKVRARLRRPSSRVYEEMIIDGDGSSSIHSMSTDPVA